MTEIQKAMHWLLNANTGLSSECLMATMLNGGPVEGKSWETHFHPRDSGDFNRCVGLLDAVPEFRERLDLMKQISKEWAILVEHWEELEELLKADKQINPRSAPQTYVRMKELFKLVEEE